MKFIYTTIIIVTIFLSSCSAQKNLTKVNQNDYQIVTNFVVKYNGLSTHFMINDTQLKNFYKTLKKEYQKSPPRVVIDYTKHHVALVNYKHINSYNIDSISGKKNAYYLHLSQINNIDYKKDSSNLLMMIVPKKITSVVVYKK
ncbi:hypothetical protein [Empedobacter sedimenti]|uniref:hypothetical protein n=1 Tax=Empedobacter sedimenti TaxID=3042610 RepID=UPI0024A79A5B|nr:hypothetical protein [Empedobacter sedimenti]